MLLSQNTVMSTKFPFVVTMVAETFVMDSA